MVQKFCPGSVEHLGDGEEVKMGEQGEGKWYMGEL